MNARSFVLFLILAASACGRVTPVRELSCLPDIYPDYKEVTIPTNVAPLNFSWLGDNGSEGLSDTRCKLGVRVSQLFRDGCGRFSGTPCRLDVRCDAGEWQVRGRKGLFSFSRRMWKKMVSADEIEFTVLVLKDGEWLAYAPFKVYVSQDLIDPWLSYRLIFPGYETYNDMGIYQRNLESFDSRPVLKNRLTNGNCLNCHSYCNGNPEKMLFHYRGVSGGTFINDCGALEKMNTKTDSTDGPFVYPNWHPSEGYVTFSVNKTFQNFIGGGDRIEVYDTVSDVVVYDVLGNRAFWSPLTKSPERFETFPTFSPDGRWLYFCSAEAVKNLPDDYAEVKYALMRIAFNPEDGSFGDRLETVFDAPAIGKSVSFPRISPDGRWLAFTLHKYGNFSIWHRDADIWLLDLDRLGDSCEGGRNGVGGGGCTKEPSDCCAAWPATALNSDETESYHCWSSNGRWLVFSSRRDDGLFTRPYVAYIDTNGDARKPFMLPQKNPKEYYEDLMYSYNIPELMTGPVTVPARTMAKVLRESPGKDVGL